MNTYRPTDMPRQEYLLAAWKRALFMILGTFLIGGGLFFGFASSSGATVSVVSSLFFLCGGIYTIAYALLARVVIEGSRIRVRGAFREQSADLSNIEGYRTVKSRNGTYTQLCLKQGGGTISLSNAFETDGDYRAWFQQLTDLDTRDRELLLDEIARKETLGSSPKERLGALSMAKAWNILILIATIAAAVALNFADSDLRLPAAAALALAPVAVLLMIWQSPLLYAIMKPRSDPRTDLGMILIVAGLGLLFRDRGVHLVAQQPILWIAAAITIAYTAGLYNSLRADNALYGRLIGLLFFIGVYGYSLVVLADSLPDQSQAKTFTSSVIAKRVSHGGRSTSYILELAPWGPVEDRNSLSVSSREYSKTATGDQICLLLHPGTLHVQWYEHIACSTRPWYSSQQ
jgi:drug/metabolite transporter (DMT)-like permease